MHGAELTPGGGGGWIHLKKRDHLLFLPVGLFDEDLAQTFDTPDPLRQEELLILRTDARHLARPKGTLNTKGAHETHA